MSKDSYREPTRKSSSSQSTRDRNERKASGSSIRSHRTPERKGTSAKDLEEELFNLSRSGAASPPPAYRETETSQVVDPITRASSGSHFPVNNDESDKGKWTASKIFWMGLLGLPLAVACTLMVLITASGSSWRNTFCIARISLPSDVYEPLLQAAQSTTGKSSTNNQSVTTSLEGRGEILAVTGIPATANVGGYLTLGVWGWCLSTGDDTPTCSDTDAWWGMQSFIGSAKLPSGSLTAGDFSPGLIHGLVVNELAMPFVLSATVWMFLHIWHRYYKEDRTAELGWLPIGSYFLATVFCCVAWAIDSSLAKSLSSNLGSYTVIKGTGTTLVGAAASTLSAFFLLVFIITLRRRVKRRRQDFVRRTVEDEEKVVGDGDIELERELERELSIRGGKKGKKERSRTLPSERDRGRDRRHKRRHGTR
ncbi:hypothetical protein M231_07090 [Tremella mesenterica]|uniref:Uncharacterized protein n=1 Tax=Tremella mesenterica TaxID=5217 RepID=A0A4V1M352_TREME|nr:hypothetical protein M231_07090 [Tremella mesenterica]